MKKIKDRQTYSSTIRFCISGGHLLFSITMLLIIIHLFTPIAKSATITLSATDAIGVSSLTDGTNWSDSSAPSSGNDYVATGKAIRTPATKGGYTFAGDSLTLSNSSLVHKGESGTATSSVITIYNLYMKAGSNIQNAVSVSFVLKGTMIISDTAYLKPDTTHAGFEIASTISGTGILNITSRETGSMSNAVILSGTNTYSGGTIIGAYTYVSAVSAGAFGTGNVTLNGDDSLLYITNSAAISTSGKLIISSGLSFADIALYYTGTMSIAGLSLDGGSTYLAAGTYSVDELNTLYGYDIFIESSTDSAYITVIPEPPIIGLLLIGLLFVLLQGAISRRDSCFRFSLK